MLAPASRHLRRYLSKVARLLRRVNRHSSTRMRLMRLPRARHAMKQHRRADLAGRAEGTAVVLVRIRTYTLARRSVDQCVQILGFRVERCPRLAHAKSAHLGCMSGIALFQNKT